MLKGTVTYSSNNSGGSWWLNDEDWYNLEKAGWEVKWKKAGDNFVSENGRYLGALATTAVLRNTTLREAIDEFELLTGKEANALGCSCCGTPHSFSLETEDGQYDYYSPSYPEFGESYWG